MKNNLPKTWFTSDLHLYQKNIIKGLSRWDNGGTREFKDPSHMSEEILNNLNNSVDGNDTLYILGDLDFSNDMDMVYEWLSRVICKNIHFLNGNHDYHLKKNRQVFEKFFKTWSDYKDIKVTYPLEGQDSQKEKWGGSQKIIMCHYAMRVWNGSHRGSWMLHGHSHDALDDPQLQKDANQKALHKIYSKAKTMDVGIDSAFRILGEYRPFEFHELKKIMSDRELIKVDHH